MEDPVEELVSHVVEQIRYATVTERLGAAISALKLPLEFIGDAALGDPEIGPELAAAAEHINEATQALSRAHVFTKTRLEVNAARARGQRPHTEGGTTA